MIIPHIIDQYVWNSLVSEIGAGPKGVSIGKLNPRNFENGILDLMHNKSYKDKTRQISLSLQKENYEDALCKVIIGK